MLGSPSPYWGLCFPYWGPHSYSGVPITVPGSPSPHRGLHLHTRVSISIRGLPSPCWGLHPCAWGSHALGLHSDLLDSLGQLWSCPGGASVHLPPPEASSCMWHISRDLSLPLWSLPQVQLCPATPGLVVLERLQFCCFQEFRHLSRCPPEPMVLLDQEQSAFPTLRPIPPPAPPEAGGCLSGLLSPRAAGGQPCRSQWGELTNLGFSITPFSQGFPSL